MSVPKLLFGALLCCFWLISNAQGELNRKPTVFFDCSGEACDVNYIRSEINLVNFLNERSVADVHILITSLPTGGGMEKYQLIFYGQKSFENNRDTLRFTTKANATPAEKREHLVQYIKLGLVPVVAKTLYATEVQIAMKQAEVIKPSKKDRKKQEDEWGYVVFNINAEGSLSADQNYTNRTTSGSVSMSRVTEKSRFYLGTFGSDYLYTFKVKDSSGTKKYEVNNHDFNVQHYFVFPLGQHISMGYLGRYTQSTFQNTKRKFYVTPVLELNLFKYRDINNRSFLLRYGVDYTAFEFYDTTLYNKVKQQLKGHEGSVSINFNQKWGSFSGGAYYRNYFMDPGIYSTGANVTFSIRVAGGLSFYMSGTGNIIHDQVYLQKGAATEEEILIRKRQLESSFNYYTSAGILFRFGSNNNSFVNQRIAGYRGF